MSSAEHCPERHTGFWYLPVSVVSLPGGHGAQAGTGVHGRESNSSATCAAFSAK